MVYTIGRAVSHCKLLCQEAGSRYFNELGKLCVEDALAEFYSREWPFNHGEGVLTTKASHLTGTVSVNNGSTSVTGTGTGWSTSWPSPAIIRIEGSGGDEFLATITGATALTLDKAWPYTSVTNVEYTLEFPAMEIPNYISIEAVMSSYGFHRRAEAITYAQLMEARRAWILSGYPAWYTIVPGNGTTTSKLWVSPSPTTVYTIRYTYKSAVPSFVIWDYGTATVSNGSANVSGSATHWAKTGLTLAGNYLEVTDPAAPQPNIQALISTITNDTALVLSANWSGRNATNSAYAISPQLLFPDDMIPVFRTLVESYTYARIRPEQAGNRRAIYQSMLADAIHRYARAREGQRSLGVFGGYEYNDAENGPGIPTELVVI